MKTVRKLSGAALLALVVLAGTACGALAQRVIDVQGSYDVRRNIPVFVHDGEVAHVEWRGHVVAYGGIIYAEPGSVVDLAGDATVYYRQGAHINTYAQGGHKFLCSGFTADELGHCTPTP